MKKFRPFEHNVKVINAYKINDFNELYQWYLQEEDIWLKKILAKKILDFNKIVKNDDVNEKELKLYLNYKINS